MKMKMRFSHNAARLALLASSMGFWSPGAAAQQLRASMGDCLPRWISGELGANDQGVGFANTITDRGMQVHFVYHVRVADNVATALNQVERIEFCIIDGSGSKTCPGGPWVMPTLPALQVKIRGMPRGLPYLPSWGGALPIRCLISTPRSISKITRIAIRAFGLIGCTWMG
jgi:hypothetical protein